MALLRSIATLLFVLAIPVVLVTLNVRYAFGEERLWSYGFTRYRVDLRTGLERSEVDRTASQLRDYFTDDSDEFRVQVVQNGQLVPLFSDKEVQHLADVKDLVGAVYKLQAVALAYAFVYMVTVFVWAREMPVRSLARRVFAGGLATLAILVGFGTFAVTGFERLWRQFHVISFSNDLWLLDPRTDRLIQMFPTPFWQDATFFVGFLTVGESILIGTVSLLYLRATRTSHPDRDADDAIEAAIPAGMNRSAT